MTEDEKREIKARVLLECNEARETLSLFEAKAAILADVLEKGAGFLRRSPEMIMLAENPEFPTYSQIFELAQQLKKAKGSLNEKRMAAHSLGLKGDW